MTLKVIERSPYGTPLRVEIDGFQFLKLEDSPFYQCTSPRCRSRLMISRQGVVPELLEGSSHNHFYKFSIRIHLEYGKRRFTRLWYFNKSSEFCFADLMKRFFEEEIASLTRSDCQRVCCSLFQIAANGERETVADVARKTAADGDEFVFFYRVTSIHRTATSSTVVVFDRNLSKRIGNQPGPRQLSDHLVPNDQTDDESEKGRMSQSVAANGGDAEIDQITHVVGQKF